MPHRWNLRQGLPRLSKCPAPEDMTRSGTDFERSRCADPDQVEHAIRRCLTRFFQSLLRKLSDIDFAGQYVDGSKIPARLCLEPSLVAFRIDPLASFRDAFGCIESFRVVGHRCGHDTTPAKRVLHNWCNVKGA